MKKKKKRKRARRKREREGEQLENKKEKKRIELAIRSTHASGISVVQKSKYIRISLQKHNKVAERVLSWIPIAIKSTTIIKNISP